MGRIEIPKFRNAVNMSKSPNGMMMPHPHFNQQTMMNEYMYDEEEFNVETLSVNSSAIEQYEQRASSILRQY